MKKKVCKSICAKKLPGLGHMPILYNQPLEGQPIPQKGESLIYRHALKTKSELLPCKKILQEIILSSFEENKDIEHLGWRHTLNGKLDNKFTWQTYGEVKEIAQKLGSGLLHLNLVPEVNEWKDYKLRFIAMYADNIPEWIYTDIATILYNFTTVPMFDELSTVATEYVFKKSNAPTVFVSNKHIKGVVNMINSRNPNYKCIKNIVVLQEELLTDDLLESLKSLDSNRVRWIRFNEVLKAGEEKGIIPIIESSKDQVHTLYYTSGTTGEPKAAMITHKNWATFL